MTSPSPPSLDVKLVARMVLALIVGACGAAIFLYFMLPLPYMLGALAACLIAAIVRVPLARPRYVTPPMRMVLGVAVGSAFSPELVGRVGEMAVSLAFVIPFVFAIGLVGIPFFERVAKFDRATAFYAAMPGGFNDMIAMGRDAGADIRKLSLAHASRILVIVFAVPFFLQISQGVVLGGAPVSGVHLGDLGVVEAVVLLAMGVAGWWAARRFGVSGAAMIGPMAVSAILHASGLVEAKVPRELINLAQFVLGTHAGCMFIAITVRELTTTVAAGVANAVGLLVLTAIFTTLVVELTGIDIASVLLAYSPGGQAEMNLMAVVLGTDVAYVALHHLLRLALVIVGSQIVFRRWFGRRPPAAVDDE